MRNPDKWSPMEPEEPLVPKPLGRDEEPDPPGTRRGALVGLVLWMFWWIIGEILKGFL